MSSQPIATLVATAKENYTLSRQHAEKAIEHAFRCGDALLAIKAQCKHGEWLPRLAETGIPQSTANNYMRVTQNRDKLPDPGSLPISGALKYLSDTTTREEYCQRAVAELQKEVFSDYELPEVRVTPHAVIGVMPHHAMGECTVVDGVTEIGIQPTISDTNQALEILAHELVHAIHPDDGHGPKFKETSRKIGLVGKLTSDKAGPELTSRLEVIKDRIGEYPPAVLEGKAKGKQKSRAPEIHWREYTCQDCDTRFKVYVGKSIFICAEYCPFCGQSDIEPRYLDMKKANVVPIRASDEG